MENHTLPIHYLTGRVDQRDTNFEENLLPPLGRCHIYSICSDIMEVDPGVTNRSFYQEYAYLSGWIIQTTAKGTILKTSPCH